MWRADRGRSRWLWWRFWGALPGWRAPPDYSFEFGQRGDLGDRHRPLQLEKRRTDRRPDRHVPRWWRHRAWRLRVWFLDTLWQRRDEPHPQGRVRRTPVYFSVRPDLLNRVEQ